MNLHMLLCVGICTNINFASFYFTHCYLVAFVCLLFSIYIFFFV